MIEAKWGIWVLCQIRMSTLCLPKEKVRERSETFANSASI